MDTKLIGKFNHRVLRSYDQGIELYSIAFVYYDLDGTPTDYVDAPHKHSDPDGVYIDAIEMLEAFYRPILDYSEIDFSRSVLDREDKEIGRTHTIKMED